MPELIPITDPQDCRIEPYRAIRERDLVGRHGLFIAEGAVVLTVLMSRARHRPVSLLLSAPRVATLAPVLAQVPDCVPVYVAPPAVLDQIAGINMHRGVLALGRRGAPEDPVALLRQTRLAIVLFGIANHDNLGGIFRNAAAFGAGAVLLDPQCCDPLYRKAIRVSVGAALTVPFARLDPAQDALDLLARTGFEAFALTPGGTEALEAITPPARSAILLGTEGAGLPGRILGRARTVRIGMPGGFDSLNVATASGIVLHRMTCIAAAEPRSRDGFSCS